MGEHFKNLQKIKIKEFEGKLWGLFFCGSNPGRVASELQNLALHTRRNGVNHVLWTTIQE